MIWPADRLRAPAFAAALAGSGARGGARLRHPPRAAAFGRLPHERRPDDILSFLAMAWLPPCRRRSAKAPPGCWPRCPAGCSHRPRRCSSCGSRPWRYSSLWCAGLLGTQSLLKNIAPAFVWALWWVGMTYISALAGDLSLLNPLDTPFRWAEAAYARLRPRRRLSLDLPYPQAAGMLACGDALFLVFAWMELVWEGADRPASLSLAMMAYAALAWTGMLLFGRREWLRRGEVFSIVFGLLARFSPTQVREVDGRWDGSCGPTRSVRWRASRHLRKALDRLHARRRDLRRAARDAAMGGSTPRRDDGAPRHGAAPARGLPAGMQSDGPSGRKPADLAQNGRIVHLYPHSDRHRLPPRALPVLPGDRPAVRFRSPPTRSAAAGISSAVRPLRAAGQS